MLHLRCCFAPLTRINIESNGLVRAIDSRSEQPLTTQGTTAIMDTDHKHQTGSMLWFLYTMISQCFIKS